MKNINLNLEGSFITNQEMEYIKPEIIAAQELLFSKHEQGNDMTGWIDYVDKISSEYDEIKKSAEYIKDKCEAVIILGVGGSYLGSKAAIEAIRGDFHNEIEKPSLYFAGQNISGSYLKKLIEVITNKEICLIVISKSGTTLETALSFRVLKEIVESKYKDESKNHIFVVTDKRRGALRAISDVLGYKSFVIPNNIGGRYSVITPVGLLPMAFANLNIDEFIKGIKSGMEEYKNKSFAENICCQYAAARNILNRRGKEVEILVNYEPSCISIAEWWKQLYGESEGKEGKGLFPASLNFTTDLHSMGQFVQEGRKIMFETTLNIENRKDDMTVPYDESNFDELNYVAGRSFSYINQKAFEGTFIAHKDGKVPGLVINIPEMNEYYLGKLYYFFMMSCAISGYTNDINPFTQPGVEYYKKNMFSLLGKR